MANRIEFVPGTGVTLYAGASGTFNTSTIPTYGSMGWLPLFVTTQAAWSSGTTYAGTTDLAVGAQVQAVSNTYVCITAGGGTSTVNPSSGTGGVTTPGVATGTLSDGYVWLCMGNTTADFTTLASTYQAVSQVTLDNRPALNSQGDEMIEIGVSLATAASGAAALFVTVGLQYLNATGSSYADGIGGGANQSGPGISQGTLQYPAGASTPIVGRTLIPLISGRARGFLQNGTGAALSASTHVVAFRTVSLTVNG